MVPRYLYTTGYFKRLVILKQQFTTEKGDYVNDSTKKYCSTPYLLSRIALRLLKIIGPYLVEQNHMANAQLLWYGSKHLIDDASMVAHRSTNLMYFPPICRYVDLRPVL